MGTEVLRPQDLLTEPIRFNTRRKPYYSGHNNNKSGKKPFIRSSEPKKNPAESFAKTGFVLGDVKILKRGETIEVKKTTNHLKISNSNFRSEEEVYAGSVFSSSPSPRKVPLPSFSKNFQKKIVDGGLMMKTKVSDEFAAQDLRKLLRID